MDPDWPVVRSLIWTANPFDVSPMATDNVSPECMNRSSLLSGVRWASVASTGLAGVCATPFFVMNAKLTYSTPVCAAQVGFSVCPVLRFSEKLSMVNAAHQRVGAQLSPNGFFTQPGG